MPYLPNTVFYRFLLGMLLLPPFSIHAANHDEQITHGDQLISIHYPTSLNTTERQLTHQWLQQVVAALLTVYGELPKDNFQITIERSSNRSSPVPWGHVERGNPTNVLLVINPQLGYDKLISDWTAFHELSHLLLPYRGHGNIWLSEGLATYYQNVIQARSARFDDVEMWSRILAGFERGNKEQTWRHINLTETSDNLGETRQYMRIHWSGVLYWLTIDTELRKQGKGTLDNALKQLKDCCEKHSMSARDIVRKLDELTNMNLFVPLFNKYSKSYGIPDYTSIITDSGIRKNKITGDISLDNDAPLAEIRQKILQH